MNELGFPLSNEQFYIIIFIVVLITVKYKWSDKQCDVFSASVVYKGKKNAGLL